VRWANNLALLPRRIGVQGVQASAAQTPPPSLISFPHVVTCPVCMSRACARSSTQKGWCAGGSSKRRPDAPPPLISFPHVVTCLVCMSRACARSSTQKDWCAGGSSKRRPDAPPAYQLALVASVGLQQASIRVGGASGRRRVLKRWRV